MEVEEDTMNVFTLFIVFAFGCLFSIAVLVGNRLIHIIRYGRISFTLEHQRTRPDKVQEVVRRGAYSLLAVCWVGGLATCLFFTDHLTSVFQREYEVVVCQDTCARFVAKESE